MKAVITKVTFQKEWDGKFGKMYGFSVEYDGKKAFYQSKSREQKKFVEGEEAEFTEEKRKSDKGKEYLMIKPNFNNGALGRQLKREQTKYSGFAVSYVKDLIIADKLSIDQWESASEKIFKFMVDLDKSIEL